MKVSIPGKNSTTINIVNTPKELNDLLIKFESQEADIIDQLFANWESTVKVLSHGTSSTSNQDELIKNNFKIIFDKRQNAIKLFIGAYIKKYPDNPDGVSKLFKIFADVANLENKQFFLGQLVKTSENISEKIFDDLMESADWQDKQMLRNWAFKGNVNFESEITKKLINKDYDDLLAFATANSWRLFPTGIELIRNQDDKVFRKLLTDEFATFLDKSSLHYLKEINQNYPEFKTSLLEYCYSEHLNFYYFPKIVELLPPSEKGPFIQNLFDNNIFDENSKLDPNISILLWWLEKTGKQQTFELLKNSKNFNKLIRNPYDVKLLYYLFGNEYLQKIKKLIEAKKPFNPSSYNIRKLENLWKSRSIESGNDFKYDRYDISHYCTSMENIIDGLNFNKENRNGIAHYKPITSRKELKSLIENLIDLKSNNKLPKSGLRISIPFYCKTDDGRQHHHASYLDIKVTQNRISFIFADAINGSIILPNFRTTEIDTKL